MGSGEFKGCCLIRDSGLRAVNTSAEGQHYGLKAGKEGKMKTMSLLEMQTRLKQVKNEMTRFVTNSDDWDMLSKERMYLEVQIESWGKESGISYQII